MSAIGHNDACSFILDGDRVVSNNDPEGEHPHAILANTRTAYIRRPQFVDVH